MDAVRRHTLHRRDDHFAHDFRVHFRRHDGRRRVGAHTPRIRTVITLDEALVVLRRGERQHIMPVDHDDEARFLACKEIFDDDPRTGVTERVPDQHVVDRGVRFIA